MTMGLPSEYWEEQESNKRPRMVAKPKATPGSPFSQDFGPPANAQHAAAMLTAFGPHQLALIVQAAQTLQDGSSPTPGSDVVAQGSGG